MKKGFFLSLFVMLSLFFCPKGIANTVWKPALRIWTVDDQCITYMLSEKPVISFGLNEIRLKTVSVELVFSHQELRKFEIEREEVDNVNDIIHPNVQFSVSEKGLSTNNLSPGARICVYDMQGRKIAENVADANGHCDISLKNAPRGVLIVQTPSLSFKVVRR